MSMAEFEKKIRSVTDTPFGYTLSMIGGKWRLVLLYWLVEAQPVRFNELQRKIGTITYKALSRELKEMEADGLVQRKEYPQVPPKVEYSLTEKGASLYPIMEQMCQWGTEHSRDNRFSAGKGKAGLHVPCRPLVPAGCTYPSFSILLAFPWRAWYSIYVKCPHCPEQ